MVIVPKSTLDNWVTEFKDWCPFIRVVCLIGDKTERKKVSTFMKKWPRKWDICVTSYEMCTWNQHVFEKINWQYIVLDEAHRIKNDQSQLSQTLRKFNTAHRLLLTATPANNNLHELWALLNFIEPTKFPSSECFHAFSMDELHDVLHTYMLRRLKADADPNIPDKITSNEMARMTDVQRILYSRIMQRNIDIVNGNGKMINGKRIRNMMMQLRKCANHPLLIETDLDEMDRYTIDDIIEQSGKMVIVDHLLQNLKKNGARVLVFCQMTRMLSILKYYCRLREYDYCYLDGKSTRKERIENIEAYTHNSQKFIFLLSTRAGGVGINLQTANAVILYDSDWNPQIDSQAIDRAHRLRQEKDVYVFRMITTNTIEEGIVARAKKKLNLEQMVMQKCSFKKPKTTAKNKEEELEFLDLIRLSAKHFVDK